MSFILGVNWVTKIKVV